MKLFYCPICGTIYFVGGSKCKKCNSEILRVESKNHIEYYEEKASELYGNNLEINKVLFDEEICHNPLYNSNTAEEAEIAYKEKKANEKRRRAMQESLKREEEERHRINNDPRCPTCSSYNVKRISGMKRAVHGYAFGIFSKTAFSQYECINCGYKW